jgi:hypothetical protein
MLRRRVAASVVTDRLGATNICIERRGATKVGGRRIGRKQPGASNIFDASRPPSRIRQIDLDHSVPGFDNRTAALDGLACVQALRDGLARILLCFQ